MYFISYFRFTLCLSHDDFHICQFERSGSKLVLAKARNEDCEMAAFCSVWCFNLGEVTSDIIMFMLSEYCFILFCKVSEMCIHMLHRPYNLQTTRSPENLFVEGMKTSEPILLKRQAFRKC